MPWGAQKGVQKWSFVRATCGACNPTFVHPQFLPATGQNGHIGQGVSVLLFAVRDRSVESGRKVGASKCLGLVSSFFNGVKRFGTSQFASGSRCVLNRALSPVVVCLIGCFTVPFSRSNGASFDEGRAFGT